jgi:ketosteroid isomerase-like protein
MSQRDVDLVRDLFAHWSAGNYEFIIESAQPDLEIFSRFATLGGESYRGPAGVRRWVAEIESTFDRFDVRTSDFRDLGNRVLVLGSIDLEGSSSGINIQQPMGWLFELRDGKLTRMFFYSSHEEAFKAAGLSQPDRTWGR